MSASHRSTRALSSRKPLVACVIAFSICPSPGSLRNNGGLTQTHAATSASAASRRLLHVSLRCEEQRATVTWIKSCRQDMY